MIKIAPSILSADFGNLERDIRRVATADYLHVDVMDGNFVPNISLGVPVVKSIRKCTDMFLDVHLMIDKPLRYIETFAQAGVPHYTGADSFVRNGAFAACGVNYTNLGAETANLAYQAITQGMDSMEEVYQMPGDTITVNTETAEALGADYSMFEGMAENLVTVTTTLD